MTKVRFLHKCNRCGHGCFSFKDAGIQTCRYHGPTCIWKSFKQSPVRCAACISPLWNKKRQRKRPVAIHQISPPSPTPHFIDQQQRINMDAKLLEESVLRSLETLKLMYKKDKLIKGDLNDEYNIVQETWYRTIRGLEGPDQDNLPSV